MTLNTYKLVVIDIDGTLLIRADEISNENKAALAELKRRGIRVSLCSGRATGAARTVLDQLDLDGYHIFFDGALVTNPATGENVYIKTIAPDLLRRAVDFAREHHVIFDIFTANGYFAEEESWVTDIRRDYFKVNATLADFHNLPPGEIPIKGTLVVRSAEEKAGAQEFREHFGKELHLSLTKTPAYPDVDFINVIAPGSSKRSALDALCVHLGISLEEVMAIGDGPNDIPILSVVGLGVAMGNASPDVKACSRYTTGDVDHNGVAEAIKRFLLG
jgi:Cof subfamily protein (haloacid dehalogenase superfamily)